MSIKGTDLILVVIVPKPRDLEIARLLGWYRIPLRKAPKLIAVDYLAFYQPGSFGRDGSQIQFYARMMGHELTTRRELIQDQPHHPHAREEYFKILLGPLSRLARPIQALDWKRVSFLYTTGQYFLRAETLNDLVIREEDREILWRRMRERAKQYETGAGEKAQQASDWERAFIYRLKNWLNGKK